MRTCIKKQLKILKKISLKNFVKIKTELLISSVQLVVFSHTSPFTKILFLILSKKIWNFLFNFAIIVQFVSKLAKQ